MILNPRDISALDEGIKAHFVIKYELLAVSPNGQGVYNKAWSREDLDFVNQWSQWLNNPNKRVSEFEAWKRLCFENDIVVRGVNDDKNKTFLMVGLAGLAGFGLHWLLSGKEEVKTEEKPSVSPGSIVDTFVGK